MTDAATLPRAEIFARFASADLDAVLWLGAGDAAPAELAVLSARQLRLVEPDPALAKALRAATQELRGAEVIEAAAAAQTGRATLLRYNLSAANALRTPSGLRDLFPNLHQTGTLEVETLDSAGLLEGLDLAQGRDHLLILEAPGEVTHLLEALGQAGLTAFSHLLLPLAPEPLYEGEAPGGQLQAQLNAAGFVLEALDSSDPDRPLAYLARDKARLALEEAREHWQARCVEAEKTAQTLRNDLETQARYLTAARAETAAQAKAQSEALAKLEAERIKTATEHKEALDRLRGERDEANKSAERLRKERAALRAQVESLQGQSGTIETLQDNLGVALRMQALREADLAELRTRYAAKTRESAALDQALCDVAGNLQTALAYLEAAAEPEAPAAPNSPAPSPTADRASDPASGPARRRAARKAEAEAAKAKSQAKPAARTGKPAQKAPEAAPAEDPKP